MSRRLLAASLVLLHGLALLASPSHAQQRAGGAAVRRLTTLETIRQFPNFFNLQNVVLRGEFAEDGQRVLLKADERQIEVLLGDVKTATGLVEVRGQLLDVGRLEPTDPRLSRYQGSRDPERWPKPGEELLLNVTGVTQVETATVPTVRALALEPWKFEGQTVTVTGQFRGRNLLGDVAGSPAKSRYDFVLRSVEGGAIWVSGLRPRGRGFELNVDARVDTSRWVQVTGVVRRERTMVLLEATAISLAQAPGEQPPDEDDTPAPPPTPGEVVFSSVTDGETDVAAASPLRIQFSKGLNPATIDGNIRATRMGAAAGSPPPVFQATYDVATRSVQIRFTNPERFSTVTIETLDGLRTFDGAPVAPWRLTFSF